MRKSVSPVPSIASGILGQETVQDHRRTLQRALDLDEPIWQYGELLGTELARQDVSAYSAPRTAAAWCSPSRLRAGQVVTVVVDGTGR